MDNQELKEKVLTNLRSVTQSCKGGVPLYRLQRDYKDLLGSPIPLKDLGFSSLEAFIRSIPHVISLRKNHDGELMAEGVADATTAHIVSLVSKQKADTKKKGYRKPPPHMGMRKTISSRYTYREGPRSSHSSYSSSTSHYPARSSKPRQVSPKHVPSPGATKPPPFASQSKTFKSSEQVPRKKFELAPRFAKLQQNQSNNPSPHPVAERVPSPKPIAKAQGRSTPYLSKNDSWDAIPPPMIPPPQPVGRSLPSRPRHIENSRTAQMNSLESTQNAKEFVDLYCKMNNIIHIYNTKECGQKAKYKGYLSTLTLEEKKYLSYPETKPSKNEAEEVAAQKAVEDIKKKMQEHMNSIPETPYGNTEEIRQLLARIEEIVCEKPSGMFENGIVQEYENKYKERLPAQWPDLLSQSSFVEIDKVSLVNGKIPKGANFIVRPTKELSSGNRTPSSTSSKTEFVHEGLDTFTLKKTLVDISYPQVPDIVLPKGNDWYVYVTNVSNDISVRLLDYVEDFLDLSHKMTEFYKMNTLPVTEMLEYQMYAACVNSADCPDNIVWHRVLVEEIENKTDDGLAICYFVDEGDFLYLKKENLQEMNPSFLKLPFQAIHLSLDGLDAYENCIAYELLKKEYIGETLIAKVQRSKNVPDFFPDIPGIHRTVYTTTLYDTSGPTDVNINEKLLECIKEAICSPPKLSTSSLAYLSHVTSDGLVYLRLTNPQQCWIEQELEKLFPVFEDAASVSSEIPVNKMCVAKYESGTWHRATVNENQLSSSESDMIEVFFVDYGDLAIVGKSDICELEPVSDVLACIPPQAMCCELLDAFPSPTSQWTEFATAKLLELAPFDEELIITVVENEDDGTCLDKVKLFKRNQNDEIVSINHSLACNSSLFVIDPGVSFPAKVPTKLPLQPRKSSLKNTLSSAIPDVAVPAEQMAKRLVASESSEELTWLNTPDDIRSPGAFDVQSPVSLDIVSIPDEGDYFDVFVTMAANPHNFVVQPLLPTNDLDTMIKDMMNFYSADENQLDMDISMLRKNDFYAALHSDGSWYRVRIEKIVPTNPVMVVAKFVDFGDFHTVNISNLQPLYQKFKLLPCQAIHASLSGIKPYGSDWDPVHCVNFRELVTEKVFVSRIQKKTIQTKDGFPTQFVELVLIDTKDPEKDVYIHECLIAEKKARPS